MITKEAVINNLEGLHARPAVFFIQKANEFKSSIWIEKDEQEAIDTLTALINSDFSE